MIAADRRPSGHRLVDAVALGHIGSSAFCIRRQAAVVNVDAVCNKRVSRADDVEAARAHQSSAAKACGSAGCGGDGGIVRGDIATRGWITALAGRNLVHLAGVQWMFRRIRLALAVGGAANQNRCSN